ncbi:hypothetical protein U9M48_024631 [Paspalum notatum var. saurae]|uniref:Uncharacterized protein n=1 Tax=Paspalum notatum var. saurae TaxID=547442 RepID=A0AAQ3WW68_PASNO
MQLKSNAEPIHQFLDPRSHASSPSRVHRRRQPHPLAAGLPRRISATTKPLDVDPPVEFEEQPPEASEQQRGINFEEGKYNINNT